MDRSGNQHLQSTFPPASSTTTTTATPTTTTVTPTTATTIPATTRASLPFQIPQPQPQPPQPPLSLSLHPHQPQPALPSTTTTAATATATATGTTTSWPFGIQPSISRSVGIGAAAATSTIQFGLTDQYQNTLSTLTGGPIQQQEFIRTTPTTPPPTIPTIPTIRTETPTATPGGGPSSRKRALSEMSAEERAAHKAQRTRELARAANERRKNRITAVKEELQVTRRTITGLERNIQELQAENEVMRRLLLENEQQVDIRRHHGQSTSQLPPQPPHGTGRRRQ